MEKLDPRLIAASLGAAIGNFLGGLDGLLEALIALVAVDYVTGIMCAIIERNLSSNAGFKGICQKIGIFALVGAANVLDTHLIGTGAALRSAAICFYLTNEAVSICENCARLGLPVPDKIVGVLGQVKRKN